VLVSLAKDSNVNNNNYLLIMKNKQKILIIDDNAEVRLSARFFLSNYGFEVVEADSPVTGLALLEAEAVNLVLLDMNFSLDTTSGEEGLYCLRKIMTFNESLPVVAITAWSSVDLVVKALKVGAQDFIEKPWDNQRLLQVILQCLKVDKLQKQNNKLQQQANEADNEEQQLSFVAHSSSMKMLLSQLDEVAQTKATILLTGENGTGKSTLVHYIHHKYNQQTKINQANNSALVSVNMGAIPDNLFESEMFGHTKGAFTGAHQARIGRFELAESGTLFLDEVANIPLAAQGKLLRVLESGEYEPVGSSITQNANVRLVSATNADFKSLFTQGLFRQDLYFRLNTIELKIPALRERVEDIPELAEIMLAKLCLQYDKSLMTLLPCAVERLCRYQFPGNLRELSHILERVVLMHKEVAIKAEYLMINDNYQQVDVNQENTSTLSLSKEQSMPLMTIEAAERQLIDLALSQCQGQTHEAAVLLGLSKSAIYRRLEKYKISAKDYLGN